MEYAIDGDVALRTLEKRLLEAEKQNDGTLMGELHAALGDADVYTVRSRAETLLVGLGFKQDELERPVASFSGSSTAQKCSIKSRGSSYSIWL